MEHLVYSCPKYPQPACNPHFTPHYLLTDQRQDPSSANYSFITWQMPLNTSHSWLYFPMTNQSSTLTSTVAGGHVAIAMCHTHSHTFFLHSRLWQLAHLSPVQERWLWIRSVVLNLLHSTFILYSELGHLLNWLHSWKQRTCHMQMHFWEFLVTLRPIWPRDEGHRWKKGAGLFLKD